MRTVEIDLKDPVQTLRLQRFAEKTGRTLSEAVEFFLGKKVAPYLSGSANGKKRRSGGDVLVCGGLGRHDGGKR
jgi:hypothetical protein